MGHDHTILLSLNDIDKLQSVKYKLLKPSLVASEPRIKCHQIIIVL